MTAAVLVAIVVLPSSGRDEVNIRQRLFMSTKEKSILALSFPKRALMAMSLLEAGLAEGASCVRIFLRSFLFSQFWG